MKQFLILSVRNCVDDLMAISTIANIPSLDLNRRKNGTEIKRYLDVLEKEVVYYVNIRFIELHGFCPLVIENFVSFIYPTTF